VGQDVALEASGWSGAGGGAFPVAALAGGVVLANQRLLFVLPELADLFPGGGLRRGSTLAVCRGLRPGATSLALALLSGPSKSGSWCAAVGLPELGLVAASQLGAHLERLALVPEPGAKWVVVTAALLEGFDIVLVHIPGSVKPAEARKLEARARERGSVLVVFASAWPGAVDLRLEISSTSWHGLGDGYGYLESVALELVSAGRGAASRPRRAYLHVP
jgi:hypothetical protein